MRPTRRAADAARRPTPEPDERPSSAADAEPAAPTRHPSPSAERREPPSRSAVASPTPAERDAEPRGAPLPSRCRRPDARARRRPPSRRPAGPSAGSSPTPSARPASGIAFTVPGESFLGLLDALEAAGIRVVATRHEGAAAFMAEAHGQLTGRPAVVPRDPRRRRRQPRDRDPHRPAGLDADVRRSSARSSAPSAAARRSRRSTWSARSAASPSGRGEIDDPATAAGDRSRPPSAPALGGRPGPGAPRRSPRTSSTSRCPTGTRARRRPRRTPRRPDAGDVRAVLQLLASAERPVILAGGRRPARPHARPTSSGSRSSSRSRSSPPGGAPTSIPNDHPLYLGHGRLRAPRRRPRAARRAPTRCSSSARRLNEVDDRSATRCPAPGQRWSARRPRAARRPRPALAGARASPSGRRPRVPARGASPGSRTAVLARGARRRARDGHNAADRAAWEAATRRRRRRLGRPGRPSRAGSSPTLRRLLPDDAILTTDAGNFGGWAARGFRFRRPGTFLGPTSGAMGYGLPGGDRRGARPPRSARSSRSSATAGSG